MILAATWNGTQWSGFQAERQSFDPWGERRNPDTWATQSTQATDPRVTSGADYHRGFTGHEMLDDFGLIHMNGRIYDPEIGRFLSCDPYVQVPEFSQNFNRYTYVLNNPLTLSDPTGHKINGIWAAIIVIVVIVVVTIVTWGTCTAAAAAWGGAILGSTATAAVTASVGAWAVSAIGGAFLGGIAGGLNAALTGGNFGDVLRGGIVGGLQGGVTAGLLHGLEPASGTGGFNAQTAIHVAGHGIVGGAANAAMGGKFQDGFISGAVSAAAADLGAFDFIKGNGNLAVAGRTAMAGIVGGTAAALGGGKFVNGAFTAAFQHYLNYEGGMSKEDRAVADYEASTGEKVSWLTKLFMNHETIAAVSENSAQSVMGFADGATFGLDAAARKAIYGDSYSDTGSWYYRGGYAGGVVASSVAAGGATVAVEKGVVWSGGRMAAAEAESLAAQVGAKTLQQTLGGRAIVQLERMGLNKSFAYHALWKPASILYSSNMRSFGGLVQLGKGGAILEGIELPILRFRGLYRW